MLRCKVSKQLRLVLARTSVMVAGLPGSAGLFILDYLLN